MKWMLSNATSILCIMPKKSDQILPTSYRMTEDFVFPLVKHAVGLLANPVYRLTN